jgi:hypothetical protein
MIEGRIGVTESRGRRCKKLLDNFKTTTGYWKLKQEALDRTLWRTRFASGYGPVVRQTKKLINIIYILHTYILYV